jgi:ABC-type polysaccharide/polyol phosphate transport system ATPase subunit
MSDDGEKPIDSVRGAGKPQDAETVIEVRNLSKMYKVYGRPADMFWEMITRKPRHKEFWALGDISFDVRRGEVVGVIGRNGAGKSTLLKILAGTLDRTAGSVRVNGKISAILELGTGFHPEYTGRENIYMGGICLGMSRREIDRKLDSIIDFSELGEVIDQPFKTYSSGMQARLTFSTAISVDPDILIIDEALAAGDMLFAAKCYQRIHEIATSGTTVFFVTHSLNTIYDLCSAAILLNRGRMVLKDIPRRVGYEYERLLTEERERSLPALATPPAEAAAQWQAGADAAAPGAAAAASTTCDGQFVRVEETFIQNAAGRRCSVLVYGEEYAVVVRCRFVQSCHGVNVAFLIQNGLGTIITGDNTFYRRMFLTGKAGDVVDVGFRFPCIMSNGAYLLSGGIAKPLSLDYPSGQFRILHMYRSNTPIEVIRNPYGTGLFSLETAISVVPDASRFVLPEKQVA